MVNITDNIKGNQIAIWEFCDFFSTTIGSLEVNDAALIDNIKFYENNLTLLKNKKIYLNGGLIQGHTCNVKVYNREMCFIKLLSNYISLFQLF